MRDICATPSATLISARDIARQAGARMRMTEFRGVLTATMIYDALPINDVFRRINHDKVLGVMDMRGVDKPFVFVLTQVVEAEAAMAPVV